MTSSFVANFGNSSEFLHSYIHLGNIEEVKQFLEKNPGQNHHFNDIKESAAAVALRHEKLEIYEVLISNGIILGPLEDVEAIVEKTSLDFKRKVRDINRKYSNNSKPKHLVSLYAKSKSSYNNDKQHEDKYYKEIVSAFDDLNKIRCIEWILKVCAFYEKLNIFFDFNNDSVEFMDPTLSKGVVGFAYYNIGLIYIGAKGLFIREKRNGVLGNLIHELSHFALNMIYSNKCKPYYANDSETKAKFQNIVALSQQKALVEPIIDRVFSLYPPDKQALELIVRVPHLTAFYSDNPDKYSEVTKTFPELFEFFEKHTTVGFESECLKLQAMQEVKEMNKSFGVLTLIERTQIFFNKDFVSSSNIECNATDNVILITSNIPRLTMIYFYQLLNTKKNTAGNNIFTCLEFIKSPITLDEIVKSWNLCVEPTIFIECEGLEINMEPLEKLLSQVGKQRIVVIAKVELNLSTEASKHDVKHTWRQLDAIVQNRLIVRNLNFQGNKVPLKDLLSAELFESITLENLLSDNGIIVGKQVETSQDQIYVERKYSFFTSDQLDNSESRTLTKILELVRDNKCILLSNEPGMGKTTELRTIAIKLKEKLPLSWIVFIDLKKFTNSYKKTGNVKDFDDAEKIINYFCEKILCLEGFEAKVFANLFKSGKIVVLTDGFDEISPTFKDFVMNLLKGIVDKSMNQIWISTRPHLETELVETLKPTLLKIEPFTAQNQQEYFEKFCSLKGLDKERVKSYLDAVIHITSRMSSPLVTKMIAETFEEGFTQEMNNFNLFSLYKRFVGKMVSRTFEKGSEFQNDLTKHLTSSQSIIDAHCKFAMKTILSENENAKESVELMNKDCSSFSMEEIARLGILYFDDSSHQFAHKSFAEYFVASFFIQHIFLEGNICSDIKLKPTLLCFACVIQEGSDNQMILNLMENGLKFHKISNVSINNQIMSEVLNFLSKNEDQSLLHKLLKCDCENLISITFSLLDASYLKKFLLSKDNGENILMTLAKKSSYETLQKFWQFLKSDLDPDEIERLFLEENKYGHNILEISLENKNDAVRDFLEHSFVPIFKNNEANILNQEGLILLEKTDYEGAAVKFDKACQACVEGYRRKDTFRENKDLAEAEVSNQTGEKFFDGKKYSEANEKFDAAINQCPSSRTAEIARYKNKKAESLNQMGLELWDKSNFEGAAAMQNDAYLACDDDYGGKETFKQNRDYAKAEILYQTGEKLFDNKKYSEANKKFDAAINKIEKAKNKNKKPNSLNFLGWNLWDKSNYKIVATMLNYVSRILFRDNKYLEANEKFDAAISQGPFFETTLLEKYKNKKAESLNQMGLELWKKADYEAAAAMFNTACQACDDDYEYRDTFRENKDYAKAEYLYKTGEKLYLDTKFSKAKDKFDAAISQCPSNKTASIAKYKNKKAKSLNFLGCELFKKLNYEGAALMFNDAYLACDDDYENLETFKLNRDHAKAEILYQTGEKLFDNKKYSEANEKFDAALKQCPSNKTDVITKYKNKKAETLNNLGCELFKKLNYEGAAAMQNDAYLTCDDDYGDKETFKRNRDHAKAEILYDTGKKFFDTEKYSEANEKFDAALKQCPSNKTDVITKYKNKKAETLNNLGCELFKKLNYEGAAAIFNTACHACDDDYENLETFKQNRDLAKAKIVRRRHLLRNYPSRVRRGLGSFAVD